MQLSRLLRRQSLQASQACPIPLRSRREFPARASPSPHYLSARITNESTLCGGFVQGNIARLTREQKRHLNPVDRRGTFMQIGHLRCRKVANSGGGVMAKISVRHGIARAYGYLFGRLFQVIGLSWLPAVFYAVAATFLIQRMSGAMQTAVPSDAGLLGEYAFAYFFALVIVTAFLGAVIAVPLTRDALGRREDIVAAHFVVGGREARLFFALLRFYAVETILLVALVIAAGIGVTTAARYAAANHLHLDWAGLPFQIWLNVGAGVVGAIVFVLIATKLGFLLTPVASLEKHAKLGRAAS